MTDYTPPLTDINFVLEHIAEVSSLAELDRFGQSFDAEMTQPVIEEVARFMADVVAPTNVDGDTIMSKWVDGDVVTPDSFKAAYAQYVATEFGSIPFDPTYGGGGFPWAIGVAIQELLTSSNMAFSLCPLLTQGAIDAIEHHADDDMKAAYLPKMLTGQWSGTMNLSEPQAGSDVGAVTTKAEPVGDGSYRISGQKIWIPSLCSIETHCTSFLSPGFPWASSRNLGTRNIVIPLVPGGAPGVRARTRCTMFSAMSCSPKVIQIFWPEMR